MINTVTIVFFSRFLWTGMLVGAGLAHVVLPEAFAAYYPSYLPWPQAAIMASAVVEWILAALLWSRKQRTAWLGIATLMVIYVPVHVYVITHHHEIIDPPVAIPFWLAWVRLPLQFLLIGWSGWMWKRVASKR